MSAVELRIISYEKDLKRKMNLFQRKHFPVAAANALNEIARKTANAERAQLQKKLDRPTPFSIRSINYFKAKPNDLSALIFIKDIAAKYLHYPLSGDTEVVPNRKLVPVGDGKGAVNKFGNITGLKNKSVDKAQNKFMTKDHLFKKQGKTTKLLAVWKQTIKHKKFMDFFAIGFAVIKNNYDKELDKQIKIAIKK